jgi:hypothetical protein
LRGFLTRVAAQLPTLEHPVHLGRDS